MGDFDYRAKAQAIFEDHLNGLKPQEGIAALGYALAMVLHFCPPKNADFTTTMGALVDGIGRSLQDVREHFGVETEH